MKKTTRVTALLLVVVMLVQTFAFAAQISDFSDFPKNSWSTEAMTAAVENGLIIGRGNNRLEPKSLLTRAEMAAIVTRAFGATVEKDISFFKDVKEDDWYSSVVAKAYNMQVMQGTGDDTFAPKNNISREEVFLSLSRVLHIDSENYPVLDKFSDKADVADWSKNAITGMVDVEYLNGYEDGTLRPKGKITREELAQVFHNIFKTYISEPGTYNSVAPEGSVIIRAGGVTLENVTINGDLVLADGIGAGDCRLNNVTVNGRIIVRGGEGTVYFVNVKSTGKVIINDVNGTVNFHNYRTDVPFKDNLIENTPATFLKPAATGGGTGGGGTTYYTLTFENIFGSSVGTATVANGSTINKTSGASVPAENTLGITEDHSFYGWGVYGDTVENIIANHNVKSSEEVANMKITGKQTFVPLYIDNDTGIIKGGAFGTGSSYHVNPKHVDDDHEVTPDALMDGYSTDTEYPTKWIVTEDGVTKEITSAEDLAKELNELDPNVIVKVEVAETAPRYEIRFFRLDETTPSSTVYANWQNKIEAERWPAKANILREEEGIWYFYEQTGWKLEDGTPVDENTVFSTNPTNVIAVYAEKEPMGIIVKYYFDKNGDGQFDTSDGSDELFEIQNYYQENIDKHILTESDYPDPHPEMEGNYAFVGWTTDPAKALDFENEETIPTSYEILISDSPVNLYASFVTSVVEVVFTDNASLGKAHDDVKIKVSYKTGDIVEGTIPQDFVPADEEKMYHYGWKNLETNQEVSKYDSFMLPHIKDYVTTNKTGFTFEAVYKNKLVIQFTLEDKVTIDDSKTYYMLPGQIPTPAEYPTISDAETKYVAGWAIKGKTEIYDFKAALLADTIFVPVIKDKTVVTYYDFDGNEFGEKMYFKPDEAVTEITEVPALGDYDNEYYFIGWSKTAGLIDPDQSQMFEFGKEAGEEAIELYPVLASRYEVTFIYVDSENAPDLADEYYAYAIPEEKLEEDRIPVATGFTYDGYVYTFAKWTLDGTDTDADGVIDAGEAFVFEDTAITPPTQYVFNAVYTKEAADVVAKFVYGCDINDDGTDDIESVPTSVDAVVEVPAAEPSKDSDHQYTYTFVGWSLKENGTESDVVDFATYTVKAEDVVKEGEYNVVKFYPVFTEEEVEYKVILTVDYSEDFRMVDGEDHKEWTDIEKPTVYGGSVTLPDASSDEIPVRPGTTFKYWHTEDGTEITTTSFKVEPELPADGTLPETTIVLYAYMECKVTFVDEVGNQEKTVDVQYNTVIPEEEIPAWAKTEYGFERNGDIAAEYEGMDYVHEIKHDWFNLEDFGEWKENEWEVKPAKWIEYDETLPVKSDDTVELSTRRINAEANIDIDKVQNILGGPVKLTVPYEKDSRVLTTVKDAIFMNETFVINAYNQADMEDKLFDKLRSKSLMAYGSKEILNVNKSIRLVQVMGEEALNKFIDEQLKKYFESDEAAQTLNEFLTKYLTNVTPSNEKQVAEKLGELVNGMLSNDPEGTILTLEKAAHNIAENDLTALSDVIKAYIDTSLTTEDGTKELKDLLEEAFEKYCNEHEEDFEAFLKSIVEDLLIKHPDDDMISLVTNLAIEKVKAGEFKAEIKAEIEKMADEDLAALIVSFVKNDFSFVESELKTALEDENFVISMIELLADNPAFKDTIKNLAEETLSVGGDDLKDQLNEMFLEELTDDQRKTLIDNHIKNLEASEVRELALEHIAEISNEEILSYVQGENPIIAISASDLLYYINLYQDKIDNATILAKIKEENSPIKVPSATLLSLVKDGTITISDSAVLSLVKTELLAKSDAEIAAYIADGTIPVEDSLIKGIIEKEIKAQRDSLIADAIQAAKDSGDYDDAVLALVVSEGISEEEAKERVEEEIADKVDAEIDQAIADKTTPEEIANAKASITAEQVAQYRDDIDSAINSITYTEIEDYAENYIQNSLTEIDIENNYATLVKQLELETFKSMKANVLNALDEATIEANKAAFLSLVTADIVGDIKETVITGATDEEILKIKDSIAGILKEDQDIQQTVIDKYLEDKLGSDDLGDNLEELLADSAGRHLIAVVVSKYIADPDHGTAKDTLIGEVIGTLESDIASNGTMINTAISTYISDAARKATLITKAVNMLSTKDAEDKYILDDKTGLVYKKIYESVEAIITDEDRCTPVINAYVASVLEVEEGEKVDFSEIIDIFCQGQKTFRDGVIDRFIDNLKKLPDKDDDGVGDGVEIVEEMIDAILEKMGKEGHVDEEIILVVLDYIVKHHEDEHGKELIQMLVQTIVSMDNILEFAKELGYDAVNENLAEVDKFKYEMSHEEHFQVNKNNVFIMGPLVELVEGLAFDKVVETYLKPRLPEKIYNKIPFELVAKPIYERTRMDFLTQLTDAIALAEADNIGYVYTGVTINFNPIYEIYVPIYEYALEQYENARDFADDNSGRPGKAYDKYLKENPYVDDLIELISPEKLFDEVSANHDYTEVGSGYAIRDFEEYYQIIKSASVLMDDMFLWYLENVDYTDVENVLLKAEERVLGYTNLLVSLANSYANDGIPEDIEDIYEDILANALASGDFEKVVGKVEGITNKDVEYYIDRVLANRYPEIAYDKALNKAGARAATILELYIDSKFNRYVDGDDYDRALEFLEFAYEDKNSNLTVDWTLDKVMDEDDSREFEVKGNSVVVTRTVAATND